MPAIELLFLFAHLRFALRALGRSRLGQRMRPALARLRLGLACGSRRPVRFRFGTWNLTRRIYRLWPVCGFIGGRARTWSVPVRRSRILGRLCAAFIRYWRARNGVAACFLRRIGGTRDRGSFSCGHSSGRRRRRGTSLQRIGPLVEGHSGRRRHSFGDNASIGNGGWGCSGRDVAGSQDAGALWLNIDDVRNGRPLKIASR